jgi:integrase
MRPRYYPPKTRAGIRRIPIALELGLALKTWKLLCPPTTDELVFPAPTGLAIRRSNALRYGLWPALRRAGPRRVNMHSMRHSFASALILSVPRSPKSRRFSGTPARPSRSGFTHTGSRRRIAAQWIN